MRFSLLPLVILAWVALAAGAAAQGLNTQYTFTTLTNLLARDPRAISRDGRATVASLGFRGLGDWGPPRVIRYDEAATNTVDNGCVWEPTNGIGRWIADDCEGGAIDVRWFGAVPDDLTDDSTAMLAAFAAAGSRSSVYLPKGRVIISQPLPLADRLHVRGEGDGSMIGVSNTNGIAFWNPTPGSRKYEVYLQNFAINTALGARAYAAITLTNVSYARIERVTVHAYDGKGFQFGIKPWGDSPASVGGAWSSSMVGCRIYVYAWPGQQAYAFYGSGGPEWGHGPNSWRIVDNYLNCQPDSVFGGGGTNEGSAVVFASNQNGIQISKNIFEGWYTNAVVLDTGAASTIDGNRFEHSYGSGGTNFYAVDLVNMTNVTIVGNMFQGLGGKERVVRAANSSYTLLDSSSGGPNTIDGDLIVGRTWNIRNENYLPTVDQFLLLDSTEPLTRLGMGLRTIDAGTNNPRAIMTLNANPTNGMSWAGIMHVSTPTSIPFYFYAPNSTNLAITANGSGVLGLPTTSAALSVYGNGAFGSDPSVTGGWTDMNEGVWVRTTDLADRAGFHAIVNDGVTNRRIEMMVGKTNAAIRTTATTDNLPLDFWVAGKQPLSLESSSIKVKTNVVFQGGSSLSIGGDTITDFTGAGLSVVGGVLTATGSGGGTNSWKIEVNTTEVLEPDLTDTATIGFSVVGQAVSPSVKAGSLGTNHIDPTFHALLTGGSGDVVGPASSVDGDIAAFDGTTGKLIKPAGIALTNVLTKTGATNTYQLADADLTDLADGSLTGSKVGTGIDGGNITTGTVADAQIDAAIARDSEVSAAYQPLDADLTDLADGSLTGSKVGSGIDDDNVGFDDADNLWTATTIGPALEELNDSINSGAPNGTGAKLHWSQLLGVPAGFADGTDDGAGGGGADVITTADNVLSGINQFTNGLGQVFSVPPRVLGGRINGWMAPQMTPGTNAATQAQYKVLGDGVPAVEFDGTTSEEISMFGLLGQDPDRGSFVTITFASDDTANTVCWQAQWQLLTLRGIDTNLLSAAATWTSNIPGTARVPTNITFSLNAPTGLVGSTNDFSKPYMLRVTRLPGSDSSLSNAYLIGVDHRYGL